MNFVREIWDIIWEIIGFFQFITFIDEWEEGIVLQAGKFRRVLKPGWRMHCPFGVDELYTLNIRPDAMELTEQVLTTKDGVKIVIRGVLMWTIFDIKKCTLDVENAADTLGDIAVGFIQELVERTTWRKVQTRRFRKALTRRIDKQARKWGIAVSTVKLQDIAETRVYSIFGGI